MGRVNYMLPDHRDVLFAAVGTLALVGVAFGHRPASAKSEDGSKAELRLAYFPNLTHAPALVGVSTGRFDQNLIRYRVSPRVVNAGPEAMEALLAGEVDLAYVGPSPALNTYLKTKGSALQIISGACSGGASLVARDGTAIRTLRDLDGKRVAIPQLGGTQDVSLRHFIATQGLRPREQRGTVEIIPVKNPDILTLFKQQQIDAAWVPEPWAARLERETNGHRVVDERDLWPGGHFTTTVLVARREFAVAHPEVVAQFLQAHEGVVAWINHEPEKAQTAVNDELKRLSGKALPPALLQTAWDRLTFTTDPDSQSIRAMAKSALEAGYLKGPLPDLAGLFAASAAYPKDAK